MSRTPRVSIVLPTYNGQRYLRDSIRSVLEQDYRDLELIIVDDASTDDTPSIASACARGDDRVRVIRNVINRKLPGSLNVGFEVARGDYLTWTSDDNLFRPKAIATMVASLDADLEAGLVYADMSVIDETGAMVGPAEWVKPPVHLSEGCCVGACFLYRRTLMERVGPYDDAVILAEDYDFWLRASRYTQLRHLREDLYLYRVHGGSLTATQSQRGRLAHLRCQLKNMPDLPWLDRSERSGILLNAAWSANLRGERVLAYECLSGALRLHPKTVLMDRLKVTTSAMLPRSIVNVVKRMTRARAEGIDGDCH